MINIGELYSLSVFFFVFLCLYSSLEIINLRRRRVVRILLAGGNGPDARLPSHLPYDRQLKAAPIVIIFGTSLLLLPSGPFLTAGIATILLAGNFLMFNGMRFGQEGSDHVRLYAAAFFFISSVWNVAEPVQAQKAYLILVAALGVSFYFGSALVKIVEPTWWRGEALMRALSTSLYGHPLLLSLFSAFPRLTRQLSVALLIWEITFPLAIFFAGNYILLWMAIGLLFHLSVALFMRLPLFLLSIGIMYPGIYWTSLSL
ncbi:hypothetical protein [Rhizobium ruizarguesonis]|uniref:hypothetical protein n=1 Tax=Rhizobium ruizarguesonis TaxID=2081791 RepID=UPI0010320C2F|nr:hypothetical protein [Rhizobium ruizarguesonis]TBE99682.1 hypothetical protein ELG98_25415 [Rhizobium ruizarguesonis]